MSKKPKSHQAKVCDELWRKLNILFTDNPSRKRHYRLLHDLTEPEVRAVAAMLHEMRNRNAKGEPRG